MTVQTIEAKINDCNRLSRGVMTVTVDFEDHGPSRVTHEGRVYWFTGKNGVNFASGQAVREMANEQDARLWLNMSGTEVWED